MTTVAVLLIFLSLVCVAVFWLLPQRVAQDGVAAVTIGGLALIAPVAAIWLAVTTLATPIMMRVADRTPARGAIVSMWIFTLVAALLASRELKAFGNHEVVLVGGAYFTLRHIHVLMDWLFGRLSIPTVGAYVRYQFFMPVLMAGPINRIQSFERQCARRRWDPIEFFSGAERVLFGGALVVVLGSYIFGDAIGYLNARFGDNPGFAQGWLVSAVRLLQLYATFSGLTSIALGLSLMMGLFLEENFNSPWRARNLVEFWQRWHMTLSFWCRDYVFAPVAALTHSAVIGIVAAMLALGLWHETSLYYVFWAIWQTLGIVITHVYLMWGDQLGLRRLPEPIKRVTGPASVLAWISIASPLANVFLKWIPS